jgi:short-subunit dehydrogenase
VDINSKVIIVTGASMGIGEATARLLHGRGARLALVARSKDKLNALARELEGSLVIEADMREPREIAEMIDTAYQHFGRIDALINNAGRGIYGAVEHVDKDAYADIFALNVLGPLVAMQQVVPRLRAQGGLPGQGGAIVNISSMVSKNYFINLGAYASTKYALNALSLTARQELEPDHIVVSVVYPGLTDTDFGKNAVRTDESMVSRNRAGLPGADSPEHVAERIAYALESGDAEVYMR